MEYGTRWVGWGKQRSDHEKFLVYVQIFRFYFECNEKTLKNFKPEIDTNWWLIWKDHSVLGRRGSESEDRYASVDAIVVVQASDELKWIKADSVETGSWLCYMMPEESRGCWWVEFVEQGKMKCEEILLDFLRWFRNDYIWVYLMPQDWMKSLPHPLWDWTFAYALGLSSSVTSYRERAQNWALRNSTCLKGSGEVK